jgi:predicted O-methyltransferase YrrM
VTAAQASRWFGSAAAFVSRAVNRLLMPIWIRLAAARLRSRLSRARTLRERMEAVYGFSYRRLSLGPSQIAAELAAFLEQVEELRPRTILEIGTGLGGTTVLLTQVAADDAVVVSVDLPRGPARGPLLAAGARGRQCVHCLRADSHDPGTLDRVQGVLRGRPVDVLFIDGDHTPAGVRRDLEMYTPLVRPGGWVGLHDIVPGPYEFVGGVPELWSQLKADRETREFVADWEQGGLGIGAFPYEQALAVPSES